MMLRTTPRSCFLLCLTALSLSRIRAIEAQTAVVFGATGAVGNAVFRALLAQKQPIFTKVILVGRRPFPPEVIAPVTSWAELPLEVIKVEDIADLGHVDQHAELAAMDADACFLAVGNAFPQRSDLHDWHRVDVTMAAAMTRLCGKMQATTITVFTAIDADQPDPEPYSAEELTKTETPLGWWPVLLGTMRMMGMKETAVVSAVTKMTTTTTTTQIPPLVRIFQPSNIITKELRYGWLDWTVFKFHAVFDPWLPTRYHSVTTELLADAMVTDAITILSGSTAASATTTVGEVGADGATRFTYGDFVRIVAGENVREEHAEL